MANIKNYDSKAKNLLKNILEVNSIDYIKLSTLLQKVGVNETNANLSNKIQRGKFSFSFVIQVLDVIDKDLSITKTLFILTFTKDIPFLLTTTL